MLARLPRLAVGAGALLLLLGARSSPIATGASRVVVAVNPDSSSVTLIENDSPREIAVAGTPQTVAIAGDVAYVAMREGTLTVIDLTRRSVQTTIRVDRDGYGVAAEGDRVYFTAPLSSRLHILRRSDLAHIASIATDPYPTGIATDASNVYVTHFRTGRVSVIDPTSFAVSLVISTGSDMNLSPSIFVANGRAYVPATRSNSTNVTLLFDSTVFPVVSLIDLATMQTLTSQRVLLNVQAEGGTNLPVDVVVANDKMYVVHAGSDEVLALGLTRRTGPRITVGSHPRGAAVSADGRTVYVNNVLSGTVSAIDTSSDRVTATITTTRIPLPPDVLNGKILFNTSRNTMSRDAWISCASCHFDGGTDGRTWFFADGPRSTPALFGVDETLPMHWAGDLDELEDVENTIRKVQFGSGLASGASNCDPACNAAPPNHGRSRDLDDLAAFMRSLQPPAFTPEVDPDAVVRGGKLFSDPRVGCASCHPAPLYTDRLKHDVGTGRGAGERKGSSFDTPSLRGLFDTAPYFHDGTAATLRDVLVRATGLHGNTSSLTDREIDDMAAFLQSLRFVSRPRRHAVTPH